MFIRGKRQKNQDACGQRTLGVKGSGVVFTHGERISTPRVCHKGRQPFNQVCKHDFNLFYFPLFYVLMSFCAFYIFYLFAVDKGVSLAPML